MDIDEMIVNENFAAADRFQEQLDALCWEWAHPEPVVDEWPVDWEDWVTEPSDAEMEIINQNADELLRDILGELRW